jgi:hypothetical protein
MCFVEAVLSEVIRKAYAHPQEARLTHQIAIDAMEVFKEVIRKADSRLARQIEEDIHYDARERPANMIRPGFKEVVAKEFRDLFTEDESRSR